MHYRPHAVRRIITDILLFTFKSSFMKKHLFALACLTFASSFFLSTISAQDANGHQKEVGLSFNGFDFSGFNPFSVIYKKKIADSKFRRISGTFGGFNFQNSNRLLFFSINAGLSVGIEKRKLLGRKTTFFSGPEFAVATSYSKVEGFKPTWGIFPQIGYILGLQHDFNEFWAINLEVVPSGQLSLNRFSSQDAEFSVSSSFSSNAALSIMYKF